MPRSSRRGNEADTHARAALALCDTPDKEAFHAPVAALLALARAALDQRRLDAADHELARAEALAASANQPLAHAVCTAWQRSWRTCGATRPEAGRDCARPNGPSASFPTRATPPR